MCAGVLTPAHGESDKPQDQQDDGCDPQEMDREAQAEEEQHEQQRENQ
jgi:hypothetical protein